MDDHDHDQPGRCRLSRLRDAGHGSANSPCDAAKADRGSWRSGIECRLCELKIPSALMVRCDLQGWSPMVLGIILWPALATAVQYERDDANGKNRSSNTSLQSLRLNPPPWWVTSAHPHQRTSRRECDRAGIHRPPRLGGNLYMCLVLG